MHVSVKYKDVWLDVTGTLTYEPTDRRDYWDDGFKIEHQGEDIFDLLHNEDVTKILGLAECEAAKEGLLR